MTADDDPADRESEDPPAASETDVEPADSPADADATSEPDGPVEGTDDGGSLDDLVDLSEEEPDGAEPGSPSDDSLELSEPDDATELSESDDSADSSKTDELADRPEPDDPAAESPTDSESEDTDASGGDSADEGGDPTAESDDEPTVGECYTAALYAIAQGDTEEAIPAIAGGWKRRADAESDADALAVGVLLLAYVELDFIDLPEKTLPPVLTVIDDGRDLLPEPMLALYQTLVGETPETEPSELRAGVDTSESVTRSDLETLVGAVLVETIAEAESGEDA